MTDNAVGVLLHPGEDHVVAAITERAAAAGWQTWSVVDEVEATIAREAARTRVLVTVGGDGTFLLGARLAAPNNIPVLGVNRGRLGFLTDVEIGGIAQAVADFIAGHCDMEARHLLQMDCSPHGQKISAIALNDIVVRSPGVAVTRLRVEVDGELLGEFDADGIIVATSTGSTAYALSAGGPPVDPRVPAIVVVPLAPHAVMTRAVILPDSVTLSIEVQRGHVVVAGDGEPTAELREGAVIRISQGPELRLVRVPQSQSFQSRLHQRLRFGTPLKAREHPLTPEAE